jgi:hypothetical protein
MGTQFVDGSPSLGSIFSNMAGAFESAPGKALDNIAKAEAIKAARAKQIRDQAIFDTQTTTGEKMATTLADTTSAPTPEPRTFTAADISNPAILNAPLAKLGPPNADMQFIDPVAAAELKRRYDAELPAFQSLQKAQVYSDPSKSPEIYAKSRVAVGGVPESRAEQERLGVLMKGSFDKTKGDNYVAVDPKTGETLRIMGTSPDGRIDVNGRDMEKIKPLGSVIMKAGERSLNPVAATEHSAGNNWTLTDDNLRPIPGSQITSTTEPPPTADGKRYVRAGTVPLSVPPAKALKTWGIRGKDGVVIPETIVTREAPPTEAYMEVGTLSSAPPPEPKNPLKEPVFVLDSSAKRVQAGEQLSPADAMTAASALAAAGYAPKTVLGKDAQGADRILHGVMTNEIPPQYRPLATEIDRALNLPPAEGSTPPGGTGPVRAGSVTPPIIEEKSGAARPAAQYEIQNAQNIGRASVASENIAQIIGIKDGVVPPNMQLPSMASGFVNDMWGKTYVGQQILNRMSKNDALYYTAVRQWMEPVIRSASGAAIHDSEYGNYFAQFVPQNGDSQAAVQMKYDAMKLWENTLRQASGSVKDALDTIQADPKGRTNPILQRQIEVMRTKATEKNTLGLSVPELLAAQPNSGGATLTAPAAAAPAATSASPAALPPPATRPPGLYPTPNGPMRWTGTGWTQP